MRTVEEGDTVLVHYTITFQDGRIYDSSRHKSPLQLTVGAGQFIPGLEKNIVGMWLGQIKKVLLSPSDAFGEKDPALVCTHPLSKIPPHIDASLGKRIQITQESGQVLNFRVSKIEDGLVFLDANPEVAGEKMAASIELIDIL